MKKNLLVLILFSITVAMNLLSCANKDACHDEMVAILDRVHKASFRPANQFHPAAGLGYMDSLLALPHSTPSQKRYCEYLKANIYLELGEEEKAISLLEGIVKDDPGLQVELAWKDLAVAYLRQGERANCIANHAAESCVLPVKGMGVHNDQTGSHKAIEIYQRLLEKHPNDMESGWLLNLAYMTLGKYPAGVPEKFFIPGLEGDTLVKVKPFEDVAADLKLDVNNMAGGSVVEDFDNDGYLDLLTSGMGTEEAMHYFKNNADGTFTDLSDKVGLKGITGGLNMVQADYNNDGFKDVLVLRGAWKKQFGEEPNSLLRNNGDGTFTDVTTQSGLLSYHPTQTATWNDFNNDGWVDLFIGNESSPAQFEQGHPCELYINNQDGTFREIATAAMCDIELYVKGVTSGDYDHDGWKDLFLSTMNGQRVLLKNMGPQQNKEIGFADATHIAGLDHEHGNTFPTWFFDYDNDGWLDIFACDYTFRHTLAYYAAAEKLNIPEGNPQKMLLYRNNHNGTFTNMADSLGLTKVTFSMGSNFGDIDNDGWLDMYLGNGNPDYKSLIPNKMFKNLEGKKFADVTTSARVGHLQKGHGVSFADMDNDGDQDVYIEMGGAFPGDAYQNAFFLNPGQSNNRWISLQLEGTKANRAAIGTSIKITFTENGKTRSVYRDVNSGGSFGASPLRREIGVGQATTIDAIEIRWHGSNTVQVFKNVGVNQFFRITEGDNKMQKLDLKLLIWSLPDKLCLPLASNTL